MRRCLGTALVVALLVLASMVASLAQGPGGQGSNMFSQMREKYKYTFQLMSMARHIAEIDKDAKYKLTQDQAKKVLAVLQPLRSKPKLTQDQAKDTLKKLKPIFTVNQLNAMARIKDQRPGGGQRPMGQGQPGQNQGRPSGNRAPGARHFDPNAMKDFNPFYANPKADDEFAKRRAARWNEFFTALNNRAKGVKTATPAKAPAKKAPAKK